MEYLKKCPEITVIRECCNGNKGDRSACSPHRIKEQTVYDAVLAIESGMSNQQGWLAQFKQYENIQELSRSVVVSLIDRIYIRDNKDIDVKLREHLYDAAEKVLVYDGKSVEIVWRFGEAEDEENC